MAADGLESVYQHHDANQHNAALAPGVGRRESEENAPAGLLQGVRQRMEGHDPWANVDMAVSFSSEAEYNHERHHS